MSGRKWSQRSNWGHHLRGEVSPLYINGHSMKCLLNLDAWLPHTWKTFERYSEMMGAGEEHSRWKTWAFLLRAAGTQNRVLDIDTIWWDGAAGSFYGVAMETMWTMNWRTSWGTSEEKLLQVTRWVALSHSCNNTFKLAFGGGESFGMWGKWVGSPRWLLWLDRLDRGV